MIRAIERELTSQNLEYQSKRKSQRLHAPELHVMKTGWHDRGKDQNGRRFQSKTVVLKPKEDKEFSVRSQEMCAAKIELEPGTKE
jgi:hypothetical protein